MSKQRPVTKSRPREVVERPFRRGDYLDYKISKQTKTNVWYYFYRRSDGQKGWCKLCHKQNPKFPCLIPSKFCSTSGLVTHLKVKHNISWSAAAAAAKSGRKGDTGAKKSNSESSSPSPSPTSTPSLSSSPVQQKKPKTPRQDTSHRKPGKGSLIMESLICELVTLDGIPVSIIAKSLAMRRLFQFGGYKLPSSAHAVKRLVTDYASHDNKPHHKNKNRSRE